jgi:hypothetical protein
MTLYQVWSEARGLPDGKLSLEISLGRKNALDDLQFDRVHAVPRLLIWAKSLPPVHNLEGEQIGNLESLLELPHRELSAVIKLTSELDCPAEWLHCGISGTEVSRSVHHKSGRTQIVIVPEALVIWYQYRRREAEQWRKAA